MLKARDFLGRLLSTGYLPEELPPAVTSRQFAEFCKRHFKKLRTEKDTFLKLATHYDTYTAPRTRSGRRALALVHPLAQLGISLLITERRKEIHALIRKSGTSLYSTDEDVSRTKAFAGLNFAKRRSLDAKLHSERAVILQADISRFFYTAYTHCIPWAVLGKERAKELLRINRKKLTAHWSHKFDEALQSCQSRETFGIPVGPDTSRIIAEILLAGVESDPELRPHLTHGMAFRLLDDFSLGFDSELEARHALRALRLALWRYNLQLNDEKTKITTSQLLFRDKWKLEFDKVQISQIDDAQQLRDMEYLVNLALNYAVETTTPTPAQWACRRLSRLRVPDGNLGAALDFMFRLARDFPICISHVASFLINNQDRCGNAQFRPRITDWTSLILRSHLSQGHHYEVAWALVVAGVLKIPLGKTELTVDGTFPGSVILTLLGLLRERSLLDMPLSRWDWRARLHKEAGLGENWLLHYEAVRRRWTTDAKIKNQIRQNQTLALALAENVSFLNDNILDARAINLDARTFRPKRIAADNKKNRIGKRGHPTAETYEADEEIEADEGTEDSVEELY